MNPVKELEKHGQAVWLDFLARGFIAKGDLKRLIETDGVKGVTSNPSIFEKAIGSSDEYDAPIGKALKRGDRTVADLFEAVAVEDIQNAADVLRPVYDRLKGGDGYVSLEVSPYLAMDTAGTVTEARRLWKDVNRKNLMVKVPATPEGLPAIEQLIGEGISINITLLFSKAVYLQVAEAYIAGLETYVAGGGDPSHVASVASFFVSRIDSVVDKQLDEKIARANDPSEKERLAALKGKIAIANAKLAYQDYKRLFSGPRWEKLAAKGARPQRMLWASTGTKNKDYSDVLYVEELIGPDTINTVPPATLDAFRDHGKPRDSLEENVEDARRVLEELERSGISLDTITEELVKDGVKLFADAADKLYGAVAHKRAVVLGPALDRQEISLGDGLGKALAESTEKWRASAKIRRLWQRDKSVWTGADEDKWLGWLDSPAKADIADYEDYAGRVKGQKFSDAVVLGMGGSSLGPEVLAETFGKKPGFPKLHVLDSTDPAQVRAMEAKIDIANTVFIGLDSNAEELRFWERWFAEGHLGEAQLSALDRMLDSPAVAGKTVVIYLHHHPFSFGYSVMPDVGDRNPLYNLFMQLTRPFLRLKDAYSFSQVVRDRAHVLLFGHMHYGLDCSGDGRKYGIRMALDGSSTTDADNDTGRMRYRVIDLDGMTYRVRTLKV